MLQGSARLWSGIEPYRQAFMRIRFIIIYLGGTVDGLLPFLESHLNETSESFTLVANGCSAMEHRSLQHRVASSRDRLELLDICSPGETMGHGELMTTLVRDSEGWEGIAFIDSDTIAAGPYTERIRNSLETSAAVFTGFPFWLEPEGIVAKGDEAIAWNAITPDGSILGLTPACAYRRSALIEIMDTYDLSLQLYDWSDLPSRSRARLRELDLSFAFIDTAKATNAILAASHPCSVYSCEDLFHFGAFTSTTRPGLLNGVKSVFKTLPPLALSVFIWDVASRFGFRGSRQRFLKLLRLHRLLHQSSFKILVEEGRFQEVIRLSAACLPRTELLIQQKLDDIGRNSRGFADRQVA